MDEGMTIGTLARAAGVSVETVRYYERRELLEQPERGDGYRRYSEADVERLKFVRRAKELGFTLAEIKDLLVSAECRSASGILAAARVKLGEVEERIVALGSLRDRLDGLVRTCERDDEDCVGLEVAG
ncbi:MAG TPA: MerR family transcriptional regulator [Acidimicrobiales bacterium]